MYLLIAEKPDLGRAVAAAIPGPEEYDKANQIIKKTFKGEPITIVWCYGHLLTLWDPEDYDAKYATWSMDQLPFYFENWNHKVSGCNPDGSVRENQSEEAKKKAKSLAVRVAQIRKLLNEVAAANGTVLHCGDMDQEGQLLVDEVLRYCNYKGKVLRVHDTSDTSPAALRKALNDLRPNEEFEANGYAAYGRQLSDKLFGYNLSRYYTLINGTSLAVGRVKMPTLGLVVRRDEEIEGHNKIAYYVVCPIVIVNGREIKAKFVPNKEDSHLIDGRVLDKDYAIQIATQLKGAPLSCTVTVSEKKEAPPLPFNLVKLYAYCSNKWQMQPGKVRAITQTLRDKYHAITYNRTNCQYLTTEQYHAASKTIAHAADNLGINAEQFDASIKSRCFNDDAVTEHTAMIPTGTKQNLAEFKDDERKVYEAIAKYYLAQFLPPATKLVTKLTAPGPNGGIIEATSTTIVKPGYRALLGGVDLAKNEDETPANEDEDMESALGTLSPGSYTGAVKESEVNENFTKPPARYTQASLVTDMTCIAKYCKNEAVKRMLLQKDEGKRDEHGSIGTPATRDTIVTELLKCGYLTTVKSGKREYIMSTDKGREFYHTLPDSVRGVDVSAKWWCEQEQIRMGEISPENMARDVLRTVAAIIQSGKGVMANAQTYASGVVSMTPICTCPKCGKPVYDTGKIYKCSDSECKFHIWKDDKFFAALGKTLPPKAIDIMCRTGRLAIKNCKSPKTGKTFDAVIICDFSGDRPAYSFASDEMLEPVGKCPWCGNNVVEKAKLFPCIAENCNFAIWRNGGFLDKAGKKLSSADAKAILKTGRTKLKNCKSNKDGVQKTYSVDYVVDWSDKEHVKAGPDFKK